MNRCLPPTQSVSFDISGHLFQKDTWFFKGCVPRLGGWCIYVCASTRTWVCVSLGSIECLQSEGLVSDSRPFLRQDQAHSTSHHTWTKTTFPQNWLTSSIVHSVVILTHIRVCSEVPFTVSEKFIWHRAVPAWLWSPLSCLKQTTYHG